jgi:2-polyprenyl-6-hydroxyphenyl methylase/3-demethylubiquinone-9 3-methyltransferase
MMGMNGYYTEKLAAENLKRCYDIAPPRTQQYLEAEIQYILGHLSPSHVVLELGCGYGRILARISANCAKVVGIDTSFESLTLTRNLGTSQDSIHIAQMHATSLGFPDDTFDVTLCAQNGISAFKVDPRELLSECIRVTRPGGICLLSSYSGKFWPFRLEWFRVQSDAGLLGEIDWHKTKDGVIICKDGFRATTYGADDFLTLTDGFDVKVEIIEVDESSLFCRISV